MPGLVGAVDYLGCDSRVWFERHVTLKTDEVLADDGAVIPVLVGVPDGRAPAVAVMPPIWGLGQTAHRAGEALVEAGYVTYVMDPWNRSDPKGVLTDLSAALKRAGELDMQRCQADFRSVIKAAARDERCNGDVLALGICFGGRFALLAAADGVVAGAASWHGGWLSQVIDRAPKMRCPLSLHFGSADAMIPMSEVEQIRTAFDGRDDVEIVVHEGLDHGFTNIGTEAYDEAAHKAAQSGLQRLLPHIAA